MATTRPFTRNTGSAISGTEQLGNLAIGIFQQEYADDLGGVKWWMGPDEDLGYIVAKEIPTGTQPNPVSSNQATVAFSRSPLKTELSFVNHVNGSFGQNFTTGNQAKTWLNNNGYWTSWGSSSVDQFTIYFDVSTSPNTAGWPSQILACAGTGTPLNVYITGNATTLYDAVVTQGKALYTDTGRTTLLNGLNTWYKTASAPVESEVFQVGSAGETFLWGGAC
jgi:hypothetical protein